MRPFAAAYSQEALDALMAASGYESRQALLIIDHLCRYPNRSGDAPFPQADERDLRMLTEDNLVLSYWWTMPCAKCAS